MPQNVSMHVRLLEKYMIATDKIIRIPDKKEIHAVKLFKFPDRL